MTREHSTDASTPATGQDIRERTFVFACDVVRFCEVLYGGPGVSRLLVPQLLAASNSVAAMLEEARAAESRRDLVSKCSIALKECRESHVRLHVVETCGIGPAAEATRLRKECHEILSIVSAIIRNTKRNAASDTSHSRSHS